MLDYEQTLEIAEKELSKANHLSETASNAGLRKVNDNKAEYLSSLIYYAKKNTAETASQQCKLVNNDEYDVRGVYFGGFSKKYYGIFEITTEEHAHIFTSIEEAKKVQNILKNGYGWESYKIETVKKIIDA